MQASPGYLETPSEPIKVQVSMINQEVEPETAD